MSVNLEQYFQDFIEKRLSDIYQEFTENDNRYIKLKRMHRLIEEKLLNSLDNDIKTKFMELEDISNLEISLINENVYKAGFIDGLIISNKLEKIKSSDIKLFDK